MVTSVIKAIVATTNMITRIRISNHIKINNNNNYNKNNGNNTTSQMTSKTQAISNDETLILKWKWNLQENKLKH